MRLPLVLAAAPIAFVLSACGDDTKVDDRIVDTAETDPNAVEVNLPDGQLDFPSVPANARTSVDYAGSYTQSLPGGGTRSITLADGDRYTIRDENGVESSGTYNWYADNSRILIKRDGRNEVYAVADGALYRLADKDAPTTGTMTEEMTYRRVVGPGDAVGASGSVDGSVQDVPDE